MIERDKVQTIRALQLAAMLEAEACLKFAKAAWLRDDFAKIQESIQSTDEALKRLSALSSLDMSQSELAIAVPSEALPEVQEAP